MQMQHKTFHPLLLLFLGSTLCGLACSNIKWPLRAARSQVEHPASDPVEEPSENKQQNGLDLFGRELAIEDVSFEGKAATDIQQHTEPSAGYDFDPDIGPGGKLLLFASTRFSANSHLYIKSATGATITQITDGPSNDAQPQFDPSGKRIVFASDRGGNWDIWIIDTNGRNPIQISNSPMPEVHPTWSPDGHRLAYSRINTKENRSELWIVDLKNPGIKRLIGEGLFPAWSPKGDKIAYQRARARGSRLFSIWTIDVDFDEILFPTEVANSSEAALIAPAWSPDGQRLAFSMVKSTNATPDPTAIETPGRVADIGIVDIDGRGLQRLTGHHGENYSPTWSADGRIYFSNRMDNSETIWSIRPFKPATFGDTPSATSASDRQAVQMMEADYKN